MKKFAQLFTTVSLTLLAGNSFANTAQSPKEIMPYAGPCVHLRTPYQSVNYYTGECFWDEADQRCENRDNNEDACSRIQNPYNCIRSSLNCFWDNDDQRCERRD